MNHSLSSLADAAILWKYLRIGEDPKPADVILVFGGHDPSVGPHAAALYHRKLAPVIVVSGGALHVPPSADNSIVETEAEAIASYLLEEDVPISAVILEPRATNTSENFWFTAELLKNTGIPFHRCILVTKPYTERRTLATGHKRWPDVQLQVSGPLVTFENYLAGDIPIRKIISMMVGEVHRIEGYSNQGFLLPQVIPPAVIAACSRLQEEGYTDRALK